MDVFFLFSFPGFIQFHVTHIWKPTLISRLRLRQRQSLCLCLRLRLRLKCRNRCMSLCAISYGNILILLTHYEVIIVLPPSQVITTMPQSDFYSHYLTVKTSWMWFLFAIEKFLFTCNVLIKCHRNWKYSRIQNGERMNKENGLLV